VSVDDGAADHSNVQHEIDHIILRATSSPFVNIYGFLRKTSSLIHLPWPGVPTPKDWDVILGASGYTPVRGLTMCFKNQPRDLIL